MKETRTKKEIPLRIYLFRFPNRIIHLGHALRNIHADAVLIPETVLVSTHSVGLADNLAVGVIISNNLLRFSIS